MQMAGCHDYSSDPVQDAVTVRGICESRNEFKGKADWPELQNMWEGRLVPLQRGYAGQRQNLSPAPAPFMGPDPTPSILDQLHTLREMGFIKVR